MPPVPNPMTEQDGCIGESQVPPAITVPILVSAIGNVLASFFWISTCAGAILAIPLVLLLRSEFKLYRDLKNREKVISASRIKDNAICEIVVGLWAFVPLICGIIVLFNLSKFQSGSCTGRRALSEGELRKRSRRRDVAILMFYAFLIAVVWSRAITFVSGLTGFVLDNYIFCGSRLLLYPVVFLSMVLCMMAMISRLTSQWKSKSLRYRAGVCLVILLICVGPIVALWAGSPSIKGTAQGLAERIRLKADIPAIRAWLDAYPPFSEDNPAGGIDEKSWPKCIRDISPNAAAILPLEYLQENSAKWDESLHSARGVRLFFGNQGSGHVLVVVGPANMPPPQDSDFTGVIPLDAGVYLSFVKHEE